MNTSMSIATTFCWSVRIISSPVRSPTWASRAKRWPPKSRCEDPAVRGAVEQRAPGLELVDPVGRLLGVQLGHPPVVEHLAAAHGVAEVDLPVVLGVDVAHRGGDAALGHDGVGLAEQRLADERGAQPPSLGLDGGPQPGAAGADDDHVVVVVTRTRPSRASLEDLGVGDRAAATSRTYRSVSATKMRLAQASCMCRALSGVSDLPEPVADRVLGEVVHVAAAQVPDGVAATACSTTAAPR